MHHYIWIITSKTEKDFGPKSTPEYVRKELEEDAERISQHLYQENLGLQPDEGYPPLYYDWKETGGRWTDRISPGTGQDYATTQHAALHDNGDLPNAVVTPEGRYALVSNFEEKPELRRLALHWPRNIILAQDWHS